MKTSAFFKKYFFFLLLLVVFTACSEKDDPAEPTYEGAKDALYAMLKEWYLWNDRLPEINTDWYASPMQVMDALRYQPLDRWSYIANAAAFEQYMEQGKYIGLGFGYKWDTEGYLRVSFVYHNSPLAAYGVKRGWVLNAVNGENVTALLANNRLSQAFGEDRYGVSVELQMTDTTGTEHQITATKDTIEMNTILFDKVIQTQNHKVGYLVFQNFLQTSPAELDQIFGEFKTQGVDELVVDLRYNSGGSVGTALHFSGLIAPQNADQQVLMRYVHNAERHEENLEVTLQRKANALNLQQVVFITSKSSASASELLINGLKPYMNVVLIGDDTYGKPVGMYAWKYEPYMFVPICFKILNADNQGDFYEGIPANAYRTDDLSLDFGHPEEDCLQEALYYIENGSFSGAPSKKSHPNNQLCQPKPGIKAEIGAE